MMAKCIYKSNFLCATCILSTHLHTQTNEHTHISIGKRFWESRGACVKISVKKGKISIFIHVHAYKLHYKASPYLAPPFLPPASRDAGVCVQVSRSISFSHPGVKISQPLVGSLAAPLSQHEKRQRRQKFIKPGRKICTVSVALLSIPLKHHKMWSIFGGTVFGLDQFLMIFRHLLYLGL